MSRLPSKTASPKYHEITKAVLHDLESYEKMRNTIGILKLVVMGEKDVKAERLRPQDDVFNAIERKLKDKVKIKARNRK